LAKAFFAQIAPPQLWRVLLERQSGLYGGIATKLISMTTSLIRVLHIVTKLFNGEPAEKIVGVFISINFPYLI
jgi:phage shock protein PspC (stress-responsive transcriptional regulator)